MIGRGRRGGRRCAKYFGCHFGPWGLIYRERGSHVSPWLSLNANHPWSSGSLPTTGPLCRRSSCARSPASALLRMRKADAGDLAQEVYVRMLRISDQGAIRNPVHNLYTVANNLVKEHAVLDRRQASGIDIDEAPAHERLETLPAFDGELDATRRVARLGVVLKQLRPKCRAAVELRFTHGLSYRAIAMHLEVSPQMAKKYVAQGLGHCRRRMAALG